MKPVGGENVTKHHRQTAAAGVASSSGEVFHGLPRVLVLDLDGTMIGKIVPQVCEYEVLLQTHKHKLKNMRADLVSRLRQGVVRPHLALLLSKIASGELDRVEVFVYTASDTKWANFLIPCLEEAVRFKFHRPLFTRKECVYADDEHKKSLALVSPAIYRKLRTKYRSLRHPSMVTENAVLVDNNPTVLLHPGLEGRRMVKCPTYNVAYYYDVLGRVDLDLLHSRFRRLIPVLQHNALFPDVRADDVGSLQQFVFMYFHKLAENARSAWRESAAAAAAAASDEHGSRDSRGDDMWCTVLRVLKDTNSHPLADGVVMLMNRRIREAGMYSSPHRPSSAPVIMSHPQQQHRTTRDFNAVAAPKHPSPVATTTMTMTEHPKEKHNQHRSRTLSPDAYYADTKAKGRQNNNNSDKSRVRTR